MKKISWVPLVTLSESKGSVKINILFVVVFDSEDYNEIKWHPMEIHPKAYVVFKFIGSRT